MREITQTRMITTIRMRTITTPIPITIICCIEQRDIVRTLKYMLQRKGLNKGLAHAKP